MKIESGKFYRTSKGLKVGPLIDRHPGPHERTKWRDASGRCWYADGKGFMPANGDLIAEWTDTPDLTALTTPFGLLDCDTQEALKTHGGPYEWFADEHGWRDWRPNWDWPNTYRVKPAPPTPREWWAVGLHLHNDEAAARTFLDELNDAHPDMNFGPIIHVREVLPE